jgi:hypothetical protein
MIAPILPRREDSADLSLTIVVFCETHAFLSQTSKNKPAAGFLFGSNSGLKPAARCKMMDPMCEVHGEWELQVKVVIVASKNSISLRHFSILRAGDFKFLPMDWMTRISFPVIFSFNLG